MDKIMTLETCFTGVISQANQPSLQIYCICIIIREAPSPVQCLVVSNNAS
jgi:hypothetical protein